MENEKLKPKRRGNPKSGLTGSEAMRLWNASRTPEQREAKREKQRDAAVCQLWTRKRPGNPLGGKRGKRMDPNTPVGSTTLAKIERASILRIMKEIAQTEVPLIRQAILDGILAPPPRSFPYIALITAMLDGKPTDAAATRELNSNAPLDFTTLTREQLRQRALQLAERLSTESEKRAARAEVIDAEVIPPREPTLEELQAEADRAKAEVEMHRRIQRVIALNEDPHE